MAVAPYLGENLDYVPSANAAVDFGFVAVDDRKTSSDFSGALVMVASNEATLFVVVPSG